MKLMLKKAGSEIWITPPFNPGEVEVVGYQKHLIGKYDPRGFCIKDFPYETDMDKRLQDNPELKEMVETALTNHKKRDVLFEIYDPEKATISVKKSEYDKTIEEKAELEQQILELKSKLKNANEVVGDAVEKKTRGRKKKEEEV